MVTSRPSINGMCGAPQGTCDCSGVPPRHSWQLQRQRVRMTTGRRLSQGDDEQRGRVEAAVLRGRRRGGAGLCSYW